MNNASMPNYVMDKSEIPAKFPTHRHGSEFWEHLGRTIASFGYLEEILSRAIFSFSLTQPYKNKRELDEAYKKWVLFMERTLSDPLGGLIDSYGKCVRKHPRSDLTDGNLKTFLDRLREASKIRNVLCHGSWGVPDSNGASVPFFVNRQNEKFETPIDCKFLVQVQDEAVDLICDVISSVTRMGWAFPGSGGPGQPIVEEGE